MMAMIIIMTTTTTMMMVVVVVVVVVIGDDPFEVHTRCVAIHTESCVCDVAYLSYAAH
jgi:hypothetical protein